MANKKATIPVFIQKRITRKNTARLLIVGVAVMTVGFFINFFTLMAVYDLAAKCNTYSCNETLENEQLYVRIGSTLICAGIALIIITAIAYIYLELNKRKVTKK